MDQTMKLFYKRVVLLIIITLHEQISKAQTSTPKSECHHDVNYTEGSKFESNLNAVLNDLVQHASQSRYNTSEHGQNLDQVYGLLQCRGDTTLHQCYNCSKQANATLRQSCGNASGGLIWFNECFLRYENHSFLGQLETDGDDNYYLSDDNYVSSPDVFSAALGRLFDNLTAEAASAFNSYASGTTTDSLSRKIYALVQCWGDTSSDDCKTCLSDVINFIITVYGGHKGVRGVMRSCTAHYEMHPFFNSTAATTPSAKITQMINKSSDKLPLILGVAGGSLLVVLVFTCLVTTRRRLKSIIFRRPNKGHGQVEEDTLISEDRQIVFTMKALKDATGNFHDNNKLGEGGFGAVYKGITEDGKEIAIKKLSLTSLQGKKEFLNEVELVAKIQHRNLVNILGCCAEGSERLLVYEYLPNKSLDKILFDPKKRNKLDWQKRYNVIMGVARGLLYLHEDSQLRIIHRDIKASNILLDERLNPKIADFGLARLFPEDGSDVNTRIAGTYGYMAPEYGMQGQLSLKADVYSFGVLLLEIITGRKNTDYSLSLEKQIILEWAWRLYKRGNIMQMIESTIVETCDQEQALRCIHVGLLCTQADPSLRPRMSTVNLMLSSQSVTLTNPTKPGFVSSSVSQNSNSPSSGPGLVHSSAIISSLSSDNPVHITSSPSSVSSQAPLSNPDASITVLLPR